MVVVKFVFDLIGWFIGENICIKEVGEFFVMYVEYIGDVEEFFQEEKFLILFLRLL